MRCYFFTNPYYGGIQQGIQPLHATARLFVKYASAGRPESIQADDLWEWAIHGETVICLNGGWYKSMSATLEFMKDKENPYAFCEFYEEKDAIGAEVLTSIGIVLPEKIYGAAEYIRKGIAEFNMGQPPHFTKPRLVLADGAHGEMADDCCRICQESGSYSQWEIDFITKHLNVCGLAK